MLWLTPNLAPRTIATLRQLTPRAFSFAFKIAYQRLAGFWLSSGLGLGVVKNRGFGPGASHDWVGLRGTYANLTPDDATWRQTKTNRKFWMDLRQQT